MSAGNEAIKAAGWRHLSYVLAAVIVVLLLTGCSTTRYVKVHCVTPQQWQELHEAEPPKVAKRLAGRADEDVKIIAGSNVRLRAWGNGLLGVLQGCRGR